MKKVCWKKTLKRNATVENTALRTVVNNAPMKAQRSGE